MHFRRLCLEPAHALPVRCPWAGLLELPCLCVLQALIAYMVAQHQALLLVSKAYRRLDNAAQTILGVHGAYTLVYMFQVVPYTILACRLMFGSDFIGVFQQNSHWLFVFVSMQAVMLLVEGTIRAVLRRNMLLVMHHLVWYGTLLIALVHHSILAIKVGLWLQVFQAFEFGLYPTLIAYRLGAPTWLFRAFGYFGLSVFGVTRIAQAILLIALYAGSWHRVAAMGDLATYWVTLVFVLMVFVFQFYTIKLHCQLLRKRPAGKSVHPSNQPGPVTTGVNGKDVVVGSEADSKVVPLASHPPAPGFTV